MKVLNIISAIIFFFLGIFLIFFGGLAIYAAIPLMPDWVKLICISVILLGTGWFLLKYPIEFLTHKENEN